MSNLLTINTSRASNVLLADMKAKRVPMMFGAPGIGKSAIVKALADKMGLKLIDMRLAQHEPADLVGFPMPNTQTGRMDFLAPSDIPLATDTVPEGFKGWLLFLDELAQSAPMVQNAALRLILDRQVGQHMLHDQCYIVAAGNRQSDGAFVGSMSTALMSRMSCYELDLSFDGWMDWALGANVHPTVLAFLNFRQDRLHMFDPQKREPFPCPRGWETVGAKLRLNDAEPTGLSVTELAAGAIGTGAAVELNAFVGLFTDLPSFDAIVGDPASAPLPTASDQRYAVVGMLAGRVTPQTVDAVVEYTERMPKEFHMLLVKLIARNSELVAASKKLVGMMIGVGNVLRG